jgi:1-deoxy-D-xylulose-5-phosphate reductoisomerase
MKNRTRHISILGSTGSIGCSTLDVIRNEKHDSFEVSCLTCNNNLELVLEQAKEFKPKLLVTSQENQQKLEKMVKTANLDIQVAAGREGLLTAATWPEADTVVAALVGQIGISSTLAALEANRRVCLANKETLVAGGHLVQQILDSGKGELVPIDSEHSAVFQLLEGHKKEDIAEIILTASGGPFRTTSRSKLKKVTRQDALKHPNWVMGSKITIDSATLMNKGLEVIEAIRLFDFSPEQIRVVVHPQSIIHSMIRFKDGSIFAQMGPTDMRMPIHYALHWPTMKEQNMLPPLDFSKLSSLTFENPNFEKFPCLALAYQAIKTGGSMPCVLNSANEVAVELFLAEKIGFTDIPKMVEIAMQNHKVIANPTLEDLQSIDEEIRVSCLTHQTVSKEIS